MRRYLRNIFTGTCMSKAWVPLKGCLVMHW
jgi:hypothetical protein